jgi:hypothetical protein
VKSRRVLLGSVGLNVGALVAAVGLNSAVRAVAVANSSANVSREPYALCILAAAIALLVLRHSPVRHAVLAVATRRALGFAIVVLFLSVLASLGAATKEKAYIAAMKSDLRNLTDLEEQVRADSGHYTANVGERLVPAPFVAISPIRVSASGWSATASIRGTPHRCSVYVGPTPEPPARQPGVPACGAVPVVEAMRGVAKAIPVLALGLALAIAGATWRRGP